MGREKIEGVEVRKTSMRVKFTYQGKQVREPVTLDGVPLAPTLANIKFADNLVTGIRKKIAAGTFDYRVEFPDSKNAPKATGRTGEELFFDLIDRWYDLLELKASTKSQYRRHKDLFWKVHLPNDPIKTFVYSDIKSALQKGTWKSNKSRNNQLSIIRSVFELAVLDTQIPANPCKGLKYADVQKKKPDPFTQEEVRMILAELLAKYDAQIHNIYQFQFYAGLRTSEVIALKWSKVDFNKKTILIDSVNVYDEEQDSTKTMEPRLVRLNSHAMAAIERQKVLTYEAGQEVFHDPYYGAPWLYARITDSHFWAPTLKRLGIRHRRPYNTRHTYATLGLMAGLNPAFMARQMGHSSEIFFRVYTDWIDGENDDRQLALMETELSRLAQS
jgi:integrase